MSRRRLAALALAVAVPLAAPPLAAQGRPLTASLAVGAAEHRVDAGDGVEQSTGAYLSGELRRAVLPWLELRLRAAGGALSARSDGAADRTLSEGELVAATTPLPWLTVTAGARSRRYASDLGDQRWLGATLGAESRVALLGDAVQGLVHLAVMPAATVTDHPRPSVALGAGAGVEVRRDRLSAAVVYAFERYDFAPTRRLRDGVTVRRLEQLATLGVRASVRLGK